MPRTVVLRHDLPDGSSHFDWLIARDDRERGADERVLVAFRLAASPADPNVSRLPATRMPDHRVLYLDYQGPVSGDRGTVTRVGEGWAAIDREHEDRILFRADLGSGRRRWHATRVEGDSWIFEAR